MRQNPTGLPWRTVALITAAVLIPIVTYFALPFMPALGEPPEVHSGGYSFPASPLAMRPLAIGPSGEYPARITNVQIVDFDGDRLPDVLVCDALQHAVVLYRQTTDGSWDERFLERDIPAPAHVTPVDIDQDGDLDLLVAVLGDVSPNNGVIGRVLLLEQQDGDFVQRVLLDDVRRVADVQAGDLDGDQDLDLAVAVFGYAHGRVLWLENVGSGRFFERELLNAPGTIHVPLADYDGDGDLDIAAIVSQNEEELWIFENLGQKQFQPRLVWHTPNYDIGSAGLVQADLDQDGDADLLLPVGDNLEDVAAYPQSYHGLLWFENQGGWQFTPRRVAEFGGTYAADVGDLDGDQDLDVVLVSMTNEFHRDGRASAVWLENDGEQNFRTWQLADRPAHLVTVACGDLNRDGRADVVAGTLHVLSSGDPTGRVAAWISEKGGSQ